MNTLSNKVIQRLCSDQVITSVSSVVKELVDNAIDANAHSITITVKGKGGLDSVEVVDDGKGISKADRAIMCHRYTTSKLFSFKDLENIQTHGFRGVALHSLCDLATVRITTMTKNDTHGEILVFGKDGKLMSAHPKRPCMVGTRVQVLHLFQSRPVRALVAKEKEKNEHGALKLLLMRYSLAYYQVHFRLRIQAESKTIAFVRAPVPDLRNAFASIFSSSLLSCMIPVDVREEDVHITGMIPQLFPFVPKLSRSSADRLFLSLHHRPLADSMLAKMIAKTWRRFVGEQTTKKYPWVVLNIDMDPSNADVNVTPDKMTVLWKNEQILLLCVRKIWPLAEPEKDAETSSPIEALEMERDPVEEVEENTAQPRPLALEDVEENPVRRAKRSLWEEMEDQPAQPKPRPKEMATIPWKQTTLEVVGKEVYEHQETKDPRPVEKVVEQAKQLRQLSPDALVNMQVETAVNISPPRSSRNPSPVCMVGALDKDVAIVRVRNELYAFGVKQALERKRHRSSEEQREDVKRVLLSLWEEQGENMVKAICPHNNPLFSKIQDV